MYCPDLPLTVEAAAADAQPINVTTDIDVDGFESFVDALIKEYNGVLLIEPE
jgi:hypothetical protein